MVDLYEIACWKWKRPTGEGGPITFYVEDVLGAVALEVVLLFWTGLRLV